MHEQLEHTCQRLGITFAELGIVVVDHGSRREASNLALLDVVDLFRRSTPFQLVEPAHMELADPSIADAFSTLVAAGARHVVVHPYFLLPGRHWAQDIPALAASAAAEHPEIGYTVTAPLGIHELMSTIMTERIEQCLQHVAGEVPSCDLCDEVGKCKREVGDESQ